MIDLVQERVACGRFRIRKRLFFGIQMLKGSRRQRITKLLRSIEKKLDIENSKVTLADFIRLTQLERDLEDEEQPREIIVTWQDPAERRCESE